ncbi:hypothetical protein CVCC1112_4172 [Paenarthrobacter nicotinovorans]|nr:hypothetical protein CVCC1112_4172 [Paenarthrobacter nicotinovorans]
MGGLPELRQLNQLRYVCAVTEVWSVPNPELQGALPRQIRNAQQKVRVS